MRLIEFSAIDDGEVRLRTTEAWTAHEDMTLLRLGPTVAAQILHRTQKSASSRLHQLRENGVTLEALQREQQEARPKYDRGLSCSDHVSTVCRKTRDVPPAHWRRCAELAGRFQFLNFALQRWPPRPCIET